MSRRAVPLRQALALACLLLLALAVLAQHDALPTQAQGQPAASGTPTAAAAPNQAGLIIRHGDGRVVTACVAFAEPEISGAELLERSGFAYVAQGSGMGAAVCQLDGEGCGYPTEDCFCRCRGGACMYWAYAQLRAGQWNYATLGASSVRVRHGDVEGWAWGSGSVTQGAQPPVLSFDQVCGGDGVPAASAAPTAPRVPAGPTPLASPHGAAHDSPGSPARGQPVALYNYLAFGVLALLLLAGIVVMRRR